MSDDIEAIVAKVMRERRAYYERANARKREIDLHDLVERVLSSPVKE